MASLTLKNLPEDLLARLRARAASDRRSLNREVLHLLDRALSAPEGERLHEYRAQAEAQLEAWRRIAGRWASRRGSRKERAEVYRRRTRGRKVDL